MSTNLSSMDKMQAETYVEYHNGNTGTGYLL